MSTFSTHHHGMGCWLFCVTYRPCPWRTFLTPTAGVALPAKDGRGEERQREQSAIQSHHLPPACLASLNLAQFQLSPCSVLLLSLYQPSPLFLPALPLLTLVALISLSMPHCFCCLFFFSVKPWPRPMFCLIFCAFHFGGQRGESISNTSNLADWSAGHGRVNVCYVH